MKCITKILIFLTLMSYEANGQNKVLYHEYSPTASSWNVLEWNVENPEEKRWIIRETLDKNGRVILLEFLKNGELIKDNLCYLANRVEFEYRKNQIIERLYNDDQELLATDYEMWYKSIHYLDKDNRIKKIKRYSKYDFTNINAEEIQKWKTEWAPEHRIEKPDSTTMLQVDYFYHSFAKMNGIYPVSVNFELNEAHYYYGDEPEKTSILNGIKN